MRVEQRERQEREECVFSEPAEASDTLPASSLKDDMGRRTCSDFDLRSSATLKDPEMWLCDPEVLLLLDLRRRLC